MLRAAIVWLHVTLAGAPSRRPASSSWLSHAQVGIPRPSLPEPRSDVSGGSVCTHTRSDENLLSVPAFGTKEGEP